jgi:dimethylargininase
MGQGRALIARSAHPVRAHEAESVAAALAAGGLALTQLEGPATLDGGDVLRLGDRLFVSPTGRTNQAGIDALALAFPGFSVVAVPLPEDILHLKCVCSRPVADAVVVAADTVDPVVFGSARVCLVPRAELYAANTVGRAGRVLVADGYPQTRAALTAMGLEVRTLDMSEFRLADGSLTCLSLREPG